MQVVATPRAAQLVARESELEQALHSLRFGGGVMITGEAGVGKTALAAAVAGRLNAPPVGWVVATAASRGTPLGALATLLPSDLATIHPALVAQHVDARLRELGPGPRSSAPPVLVVDDAQLLDAQSAAVLLSLVSARAVRLLVTMRSGDAPSDAVTALWKERFLIRLDLMPLGLVATRRLLESLLDGPVASGTVEMLWSSSHGNPLYVSELARFGADHGALEQRAGVWWWLGGTDLPPRLSELLTRRMASVSEEGREAIDFLALGEPLPYETLAAVAGEEAIIELDQAQILTSDERGGVLTVRFAHPLLHGVAEAQLSATRRRSLAGRLRKAPARHVDLLRRATWEDQGTDEPDVALLLAAADQVMLNDATAAIRLATRARRAGGGIRATIALAAAQAGDGRPDLAAETLQRAPEATSADEVYALLKERLGLALWGHRRPDQARAVLAEMRDALPPGFANRILGAEAVVTLFSGGGAAAVPLARQLLAGDPSPSDRVRALTVLTGALAFADRGPAAIEAGQQLLDALADTRVAAPRAGLAHALIAVTGLFFGVEYRLPRAVGLLGRWPDLPGRLEPETPGPAALRSAATDDSGELGWPLLVGVRRHLAGDLLGAVGPLREAYVQQLAGEGMFSSEATAELVVVLSELGHVDEAEEIMRDHPPDAVAIIPGLRPWAEAAVQAAAGRHGRATELALAGARVAASRGVSAMAMNFLTDAARWGDARQAAAALPALGVPLDSDVQRVRAADLLARARRRPDALLDAAEAQLLAGFSRHALELAELAREHDGSGASARRAAGVLRQARERLGDQGGSAAAPAANPLTRRETEVARLASRGNTDREIADELFLSIRTVQSHLASAYRKLGIGSRTELAAIAV